MSGPFDPLPRTPLEHFRLLFYGAVNRLAHVVPAGDAPEFLAAYRRELSAAGDIAPEAWGSVVRAWEEGGERLPLRALADAGELDDDALELLFLCGVVEEDARFAALFGEPGRPTLGMLDLWMPGVARASLGRLLALGLLTVPELDAPRPAWTPRPVLPVWDAARGAPDPAQLPWARLHPAPDLVALEDVIAAPGVAEAAARLPGVLAAGRASALVVRGPAAGGRRTLVGAVARALDRAVLEVEPAALADERWRSVGALATLLRAVPLVTVDPGPGETIEIAAPLGTDAPLAIVTGRTGGVGGEAVEQAATLTIELPSADERAAHWRAALPELDAADLAERHRMTGGNIRRTAALARCEAALAGREIPAVDDVRAAARTLHAQLLDTLARRVDTTSDWRGLSTADETLTELALLELRCRERDRLHAQALRGPGAVGAAGVRALFTGPSGTGKTLAARLLAGALGVDLYALDLATVVDKYLGETEKNLSRIFARAEEADVALLLDEGDALLTGRTAVRTANDRYANLETNYLLQRLETFEGLLLITTNSAERIDAAFRRRIDVVVEFRAPEPLERWSIWRSHLPAEAAVPDEVLERISLRCALTGGQIRNAALHATLLSLRDGAHVTGEHVVAAVRREYRKAGEVAPLHDGAGVA